MRFQLYRRVTLRGRLWFWRLRAANGEIIAQSEGYRNKADALHAIDLLFNLPPSTIIETVP